MPLPSRQITHADLAVQLRESCRCCAPPPPPRAPRPLLAHPPTRLPAPLPPSAGEVKGELIQVLTDMVRRHQEARAQVTEAVVDAFMAVRPMDCLGLGGR